MGITQCITALFQNPRARLPVMIGLFPLYAASLAYGAAMCVRRWCYRVGLFRVKRLGAVVVCVGNITTGGTGKTPAVIHLARKLSDSGIKTAVISRGYGFRVVGDCLIVSGPDGVHRQPGQAPDEALMTARKLPGVPVVVSPDRYRAGEIALERFGSEVVIMDDGFQHLGLFRDIDILVLDADNPVGNGLVLPAGPLREPAGGAGRADALWLSGPTAERLPAALRSALEKKPVVRARAVPRRLVGRAGTSVAVGRLSGARVLAFCGIARPQRFFEMLRGLGAVLVDRAAFGDHHRFSGDDVERLNNRAHKAAAELMVTTEKDLARLSAGATFATELTALEMTLDVTGDEAVIERIAAKLRERAK